MSTLSDIKSDIQRIKPINIPSVNKREDKDTSQAHVLIGGRSYSLCDPNRRVLNLLNNLLGGPGMNSRLNISLREKRGYVYNVDSSITSYTDTGITSIYFGCDKKNVDKCISLVNKELNRLRKEKLTSSQLSTAKKQLIGQIGVMGDNHENLALALGKNFLHHNHFNTLAETARKIEAVTAEQILAVSNEIFDERSLFTLIYD